MWEIDIPRIMEAFYQYTGRFPDALERIDHKIQHSLRVAMTARELAEVLSLPSEEVSLAYLIGLVHDLGRFQQYCEYGTFVDRDSRDHAAMGAELLFDQGLIRNFIGTDAYDDIIRAAVTFHNRFSLPEGLEGAALVHSRILRDADKLDNLFSKQFESFEALFGVNSIDQEPVSGEILETFLAFRPIRSEQVQSHLDNWIKYLAFNFDFYYDASLRRAEDAGYAACLLERVAGMDPKVFSLLSGTVSDYCRRRLGE